MPRIFRMLGCWLFGHDEYTYSPMWRHCYRCARRVKYRPTDDNVKAGA